MLSALWAAIKAAALAFGWVKQSSDEATGERLAAGKAAMAAMQETEDAQNVRNEVAAEAPNDVAADLDKWVRKPSGPS